MLFIIAMKQLNHMLRKYSAEYKVSRSQEKINHLKYLDDFKLFAKNKKELEYLINAIRIHSHDIGIEFRKEKRAMQERKSGKQHMTEGMEVPNQDKIKTPGENETYKYLGILVAKSIK